MAKKEKIEEIKKDKKAKKEKKPSWVKRNWKKVLGGISLGGLVAGIGYLAKRDHDYYESLPEDPVNPGCKYDPSWEAYIPEMADEYGNIHKNVLRQTLDGQTAYYFNTSDIIPKDSKEDDEF